MDKREMIRPDGVDLYVSKVVLYAHSDNFVYFDKEHTKPVNRVTLLDLLKKGLVLVMDTGKYYYPLFFEDATTEAKFTIATAIETGASTSKELKSKES